MLASADLFGPLINERLSLLDSKMADSENQEDDHIAHLVESLVEHVINADALTVRSVLDQLGTGQFRNQLIKSQSTLLHRLIKSGKRHENSTATSGCDADFETVQILYMLVDAGADVNQRDARDQSPLWLALKGGRLSVGRVLLQCGASTSDTYKNQTLWDWITREQPKRTTLWFKKRQQFRDLFLKYGRGLVDQVSRGLFQEVRVSLNYWCRTDVQHDGKSLLSLSLENGYDHITELLIRIGPYMELAHHVLAQDVASVELWYEREKNGASQTPYPIFYSSPDGVVPLLHVAIDYQNPALIQSLIDHGHRATFPVSDEAKGDRAVLFSGLRPGVSLSVVEILVRDIMSHGEQLHQLFWFDRNPLQVALSQRCSAEIIQLLLDSGGPLLLCLRNADNQTGRDLAASLGLVEHVRTIDRTVSRWLLAEDDTCSQYRVLMALCSYELNNVIRPLLRFPSVHLYQQEFTRLQVQLEELCEALIADDEETAGNLVCFESPTLGRHNLALDARLSGDGQPLLHSAVLWNRSSMVRLMLGRERYERINGVRDQFRRSALHYAYAIRDGEPIQKLLTEAGCSEIAFDMDGRRPPDFQEMQSSPEMEQFLSRLRNRDYKAARIDPLDPKSVALHRRRQWQKRVQDFVDNPHKQHSHHHHHHHYQHHNHQGQQHLAVQLPFSKRLVSHLLAWNHWCSIL